MSIKGKLYAKTKFNKNIIEQGSPFITNFSFPDIEKIEAWSIAEGENGIMYFANRRGITTFDGKSENYFSIGKVPFIISREPQSGIIFAGCNGDFGYLITDQSGNVSFKSLSKKNDLKSDFTKILFTKNKVWFYSDEIIYSVSLNDFTKLETVIKNDNSSFTGFFNLGEKIYINILNKGIFEINNKNQPVIDCKVFDNQMIVFAIPLNKDESVIGTNSNKLYKFDGKNIKEFKTESSEYIDESVITSGVDLNENQFVILTLNGGVLLINKNNLKTENILNFRNGLPDDEIFSGTVDSYGGFWISHEFGFSRIDFTLPINLYSGYLGLEGNINSIEILDTMIYVGASEGVFYLSNVQSFKEIDLKINKTSYNTEITNDVINDKNNNISDNQEIITADDSKEQNPIEGENKKLSLKERWKKWRNKNKKSDSEPKNEENLSEKKDINENIKKNNPGKKEKKIIREDKEIIVKKKIYELQTDKKVYLKINGISGKCRQLQTFNNGLLVATNKGLYYVKSNVAIPLITDKYINRISETVNNICYVATNNGIYQIIITNDIPNAINISDGNIKNQKVVSVVQTNEGIIWAGGTNEVYRIKKEGTEGIFKFKTYDIPSINPEQIYVRKSEKKVLFFTTEDVYYYVKSKNSIDKDKNLSKDLRNNKTFLFLQNDISLLIDKEKVSTVFGNNFSEEQINYFKLFENVNSISCDKEHNLWGLTNQNRIFCIKRYDNSHVNSKFNLYVKQTILSKNDSLETIDNQVIDYDYGSLEIKLSAPFYLKQNAVEYGYSINNEEYIWSSEPSVTLSRFAPGKYNVKFKARNKLFQESNEIIVKFKIKPPFWQNAFFIIICIIIFILVTIFIFYKIGQKKQQNILKKNKELEYEVNKRTAEIKQQNEEIKAQNEEITRQNQEINRQFYEINKQNADIQSSITYASLIQQAILPEADLFNSCFKSHFIYYNPRDIVSGDFYWIKEIESKIYLAVADCTGHGVPGGFISMLGISFLNEIVTSNDFEKNGMNAGEILTVLRKKIINSLHQSDTSKTKDGMDICLIIYDKLKQEIQFSGAYNPLWLVRNSEVIEIKPDRMPVGFHKKYFEPFSNIVIEIKDDDKIYMFSDGYIDQFGGDAKQRFTRNRFKNLVLELSALTMDLQKDIFAEIFDKWRSGSIRVDDVVVLGITF